MLRRRATAAGRRCAGPWGPGCNRFVKRTSYEPVSFVETGSRAVRQLVRRFVESRLRQQCPMAPWPPACRMTWARQVVCRAMGLNSGRAVNDFGRYAAGPTGWSSCQLALYPLGPQVCTGWAPRSAS
jgi:hypothetical protein